MWRYTLAVPGVFWILTTTGWGQLTFTDQERSVAIDGSWTSVIRNIADEECLPPGTLLGFCYMPRTASERIASEAATDFSARRRHTDLVLPIMPPPANESRPSITSLEARQDSALRGEGIVLTGGIAEVRGRNAGVYDLRLSATSGVDVSFIVSRQTHVLLHGYIDRWNDCEAGAPGGTAMRGGKAILTLTGTERLVAIDMRTPAPDTTSWIPLPSCADMPGQTFEHRENLSFPLVLTPGDYNLSMLASQVATVPLVDVEAAWGPISYDVRLDVLPAPEPSTWLTALLALSALAWHRIRKAT